MTLSLSEHTANRSHGIIGIRTSNTAALIASQCIRPARVHDRNASRQLLGLAGHVVDGVRHYALTWLHQTLFYMWLFRKLLLTSHEP